MVLTAKEEALKKLDLLRNAQNLEYKRFLDFIQFYDLTFEQLGISGEEKNIIIEKAIREEVAKISQAVGNGRVEIMALAKLFDDQKKKVLFDTAVINILDDNFVKLICALLQKGK